MFNANEMHNVEQTKAFFRRILILPFNITISDNEKDIYLHTKIIKTELNGVLNLVLEGLYRLINQGDFTKSSESEEQLALYKKESDNVQLFLDDENWLPSLTNKIPLKVMYQFFREFCFDCGHRPLSRTKFVKRLELNGFEICRKTTNNGTNVYCAKKEDEAVNKIMANTKIVEAILAASNKK